MNYQGCTCDNCWQCARHGRPPVRHFEAVSLCGCTTEILTDGDSETEVTFVCPWHAAREAATQ